MSEEINFTLYQAFSKSKNGGSEVAIIDLNSLSLMSICTQDIAKKLGYPATAFLHQISSNSVTASFHSAKAELKMCGHGTIGLITWLIETNQIHPKNSDSNHLNLKLPDGTAKIEIQRRHGNSPIIGLQVKPAIFKNDQVDINRLLNILGLPITTNLSNYPIETAVGGFIHLIIPLEKILDMKSIQPDFPAITLFCNDYGLQTLAVFSTETESPEKNVHVRDFCPAVGVSESAAAGTTNAAIAGYLFRHNLLGFQESKIIRIAAEQGIEMGKPSEIYSTLLIKNGIIKKQLVSGIATWNKSSALKL